MSTVTLNAARKRVRFVGDLHLGDGSHTDSFGAKDALLVGFLQQCQRTCDAVVFMGDAVDLPQAWHVDRVRRAHPEVFEALATLADRLPVFFIRGNHDWTVDYARLFKGARGCEELRMGDAKAWHGHQLDPYCHPSKENHRLAIGAHILAERLLGFEFRVPLHEHYTWQNRVAHWLGQWYGRYRRGVANLYQRLGMSDRSERAERFVQYWSRAVWGDPHALFQPVARHLAEAPIGALICGHTHLPGVVDLPGGTYVNAGSWAFGQSCYAHWDGAAFTTHDCGTGAAVSDEAYEWMLAGRDPGDFFDWWRAHYRGWFRYGARRAP